MKKFKKLSRNDLKVINGGKVAPIDTQCGGYSTCTSSDECDPAGTGCPICSGGVCAKS